MQKNKNGYLLFYLKKKLERLHEYIGRILFCLAFNAVQYEIAILDYLNCL